MNLFFYIAGIVAILSTIMVIAQKNAIHALLYMIVSFFSIAVIFYLLDAPFIAALEIIIYAGAILVLFIFVTMMLNIVIEKKKEKRWLKPKMWVIPIILAVVLFLDLVFAVYSIPFPSVDKGVVMPKHLGVALFTQYLPAVEISAMLLLVGVIGAYHLGSQEKKVTHRFFEKK
ncbi:MAG: NADH-quinone oxidoreductase subunit J [Bacteroidales bacterium]|nr:NADH-quinone oxidoreductase subunit J [Bacteroidales bacterium]